MSKHRTEEESATVVSGSGGPPSVAQVPVQVTNIVQIISDNLPTEHAAVVTLIEELKDKTTAALKYREQLERIAIDAGVPLTSWSKKP